jgi:hypothetical protein
MIIGVDKILECIVDRHSACQSKKRNHPSEEVKGAGFKLE